MISEITLNFVELTTFFTQVVGGGGGVGDDTTKINYNLVNFSTSHFHEITLTCKMFQQPKCHMLSNQINLGQHLF